MSSCIVFPSKDCVAKTALNFTASKFNYQLTKRSFHFSCIVGWELPIIISIVFELNPVLFFPLLILCRHLLLTMMPHLPASLFELLLHWSHLHHLLLPLLHFLIHIPPLHCCALTLVVLCETLHLEL